MKKTLFLDLFMYYIVDIRTIYLVANGTGTLAFVFYCNIVSGFHALIFVV